MYGKGNNGWWGVKFVWAETFDLVLYTALNLIKVSYMLITESLRSSRGPSAMFLLKDQTKSKSTFKLVFLSYRTAHICKADKMQT